MEKRIILGVGIVAFAVSALVIAQGMKASDRTPVGILAGVPNRINYQGYLTDNLGIPINGNRNMGFSIWTASSGGSSLWNEGQLVSVENGLFNVVLGVNPIPPSVFEPGLSRWLQLAVEAETLNPRTEIASVGFAYRTIKSDTADYAYLAPAVADSDWAINGRVLYPVNGNGLSMRSSNVLYGNNDSTHVNFGIACTTGASGQNFQYCTIGGGYNNDASAGSATVGGGQNNTASGYYATVGGGQNNTASYNSATVGGGNGNVASGANATVAGGAGNGATQSFATVGGGWSNDATGYSATVSGGRANNASDSFATVGGGYSNTAIGKYSFAAGKGVFLTLTADNSFGFGSNFTTTTPSCAVFHDSTATFRMGIGVANPSYPLHMGSGAYCSAGGVWTDASSREYKDNIADLGAEEALEAVKELKPVSFDYKQEKGDRYLGFVAEDVPDLVAMKDRKGLSPMDIVAALTKVVQVQQEEIECLRMEVEALKER